jgi:enamine deaminase RidA (YjgF/YER057c/UK114 family)
MTEKSTEIFRSDAGGPLEQQCREILDKAGDGRKILSVTYFIDAEDDSVYLEKDSALRAETLSHFIPEEAPLVNCASQKPLCENGLAAEILFINEYASVTRRSDYLVIESKGCRELLTQGLHSPSGGDTGEQSAGIFRRAGEILAAEGFVPSDIVRQWNYIDHITAVSGGVQNYQMFNDARSAFYGGADWSGGYPAATGIGCSAGGLMVVMYAVKAPGIVSRPIDNPLQIPAHRYSQKVLVQGKENARTTPKFERARILEDVVFVSGTAAIKGERSELSDNAAVQAEEAVDVVNHLVAPANIAAGCKSFRFRMLRVYVRRPEDAETVKKVFSARFAGVPIHFLNADICRPELLLELEGIGKAGF